MSRSKLHLIGLGGAGTNIVADICPKLKELGEGFSDIGCKFIDTTDKTIQAYPEYMDKFFRVTTRSSINDQIDGQAGERRNKTSMEDMNVSVRLFLDTGLKNNKGDYYVLIASGSGGKICPLR